MKKAANRDKARAFMFGISHTIEWRRSLPERRARRDRFKQMGLHGAISEIRSGGAPRPPDLHSFKKSPTFSTTVHAYTGSAFVFG
jgi:hypothetical protein